MLLSNIEKEAVSWHETSKFRSTDNIQSLGSKILIPILAKKTCFCKAFQTGSMGVMASGNAHLCNMFIQRKKLFPFLRNCAKKLFLVTRRDKISCKFGCQNTPFNIDPWEPKCSCSLEKYHAIAAVENWSNMWIYPLDAFMLLKHWQSWPIAPLDPSGQVNFGNL